MSKLKISRRQFLRGTSAVVVTTSCGLQLMVSNAKGREKLGGGNDRVIAYLFFRGGMDALSLFVPLTGVNRSEYESKRPNIMVPDSGGNAALPVSTDFGLHPSMTGLENLYNAGMLACVHACGMPDGTGSRSHFDSQEMFELGTPGVLSTTTGWLARHIASAPNIPGNAVTPSVATGSAPPTSMKGDFGAMTIDDANSFHPNSGRYEEEFLLSLYNPANPGDPTAIYNGGTSLDLNVQSAVDTINIIESVDLSRPASYPATTLGTKLAIIAGLTKADLGLQVATIDYGGWDMHNGLGNQGGGNFADSIGAVSDAIEAFYDDLTSVGRQNQVTMVTQTDFGRRVRENGNMGADHGTAQNMMVVGGQIKGGQFYGSFPGIRDQDLYLNTDLQATTDWRRVLAELVDEYMGNPNISTVFPGYTGYSPMGIVRGDTIFANSFESAVP